MYDDILGKMQTGLFNPRNPKSQFSNPKPGGFGTMGGGFGQWGGGTGGGTGGGKDDTAFGGPKGTSTGGTVTGQPGGGQPDPNVYTGSGVYGTNYGSLNDLLSGLGYSTTDLTDPGARYGYGAGSEYGMYFDPFDIGEYEEGMSALKGLEEGLFRDVSSQYRSQTQGMQDKLQSDLMKTRAKSSTTGLVGGAQQRQMQEAREYGEGAFGELGQKTSQKYRDIQEQIGGQLGALEGSLFDFLSGASQRALGITMADPTAAGDSGEASTGWKAQPKGNSMSESQLSQYQSVFSDLQNSTAAWSAFVGLAHTNLNQAQLNELANAIYDQYQSEGETVGG